MRPIDADKFEVYVYTTPPEYDEESYDAGVKKVIEDIDAAPTINAEHVRYGRWIMRGGKKSCSYCGERACLTRDREDFWYTVGTKYCPNCGAKMDLED